MEMFFEVLLILCTIAIAAVSLLIVLRLFKGQD